jgi:heterodisulfide reductase subunit A
LEETLRKVDKHPHIDVHLGTRISASFGDAGNFLTTVENSEGKAETLQHGAVILATGGREASTEAYGYGRSDAVITQKEMESRLAGKECDTGTLTSVVFIQCVDSREEPRNFCSRVCCPTSLKHALALKEQKRELNVYIFYRDIMTHGFAESYYTAARQSGVIFIQYETANKPRVSVPEGGGGPVTVTAVEPLLGMPVEIEADLLVLATGIAPQLPAELASAFGADTDQDGFFQEAESKWRPVDALKEGVFACGLALSPRSISETIASAAAAAQRSLRILSHDKLPAGKVVASVRHSLCSVCERCIGDCPYNARTLDLNREKVMVNPVMCQGCGQCAAVCPNSAAVVQGFRERQMMGVIDAALENVAH